MFELHCSSGCFVVIITFSVVPGGSSSRLEDVMHLAMPMLVNSTVPAEVDMSIELALMTSEMTSLAFSAWHFF